MAGKFIVLEGIDGSGKGEQVKRLQNFLFELDKRNVVLTTREPTYGKYGMLIRKHLKEDSDPRENAKLMLELYSKDRKDHLDTLVLPVLSRESGEMKHFVLSDRYYHSTYAFQRAQGNSFEDIHNIQEQFRKPDITIIIDVTAETAMERINKGRDSSEKFEQLEFMKILRQNYLDLKNLLDENIVIVDGSRSREEVFEDIKNIINGVISR